MRLAELEGVVVSGKLGVRDGAWLRRGGTDGERELQLA